MADFSIPCRRARLWLCSMARSIHLRLSASARAKASLERARERIAEWKVAPDSDHNQRQGGTRVDDRHADIAGTHFGTC